MKRKRLIFLTGVLVLIAVAGFIYVLAENGSDPKKSSSKDISASVPRSHTRKSCDQLPVDTVVGKKDSKDYVATNERKLDGPLAGFMVCRYTKAKDTSIVIIHPPNVRNGIDTIKTGDITAATTRTVQNNAYVVVTSSVKDGVYNAAASQAAAQRILAAL